MGWCYGGGMETELIMSFIHLAATAAESWSLDRPQCATKLAGRLGSVLASYRYGKGWLA